MSSASKSSVTDIRSTCVYCGENIAWISPGNSTGYWSHGPGMNGWNQFCWGTNTRAARERYTIGDPPTTPMGNDGIDAPWIPSPEEVKEIRAEPITPGPFLEEILERQDAMQHLWDSGLVWMINASILHPRGYALAAVFEDNEEGLERGAFVGDHKRVIGLTVVGDGSEPWCFGTVSGEGEGYSGKFKGHESDASYRRFCEAEQKREAVWSPKLKPVPERDSRACNGIYGQCGVEVYYDGSHLRNASNDELHSCDALPSPREIRDVYIEGSEFCIGDRVRLTVGPWRGQHATVLGPSGHKDCPIEIRIDGDSVLLPIIASESSIELL